MKDIPPIKPPLLKKDAESSESNYKAFLSEKENDLKKMSGLIKDEMQNQAEKMGEQKRSCLNASLAKQKLGWEPQISLEEGLSQTVDFFKIV